MCELNVIELVDALSHTTIVQDAWRRSQRLTIHGLIYGLQDGLIKDLGVRVSQVSQVALPFRFAKKERDVIKSRATDGEEVDQVDRKKKFKK